MARKNVDRGRKAKPANQRQSDDAGPGTKAESQTASPSRTASSPAAQRAEEIRTSAHRETVEAFVVAFILALLFRSFVAEAFVIPTGSMAPTLMGAHKEIDCDRCEQRFRIGASLEERTPETEQVVVGGVCPNCRHLNPLDLANDGNDATFSGDRILVSKFAYTLRDPKRWDVIVFKFPGNPKQNYIKRLVGLPKETVTIRHGDVYVRPTGSDERNEILRKPADTLLSMRHLVYDSSHQAKALIDAGYPARVQPWAPGAQAPPEDSWDIQRDESGLTASLSGNGSPDPKWVRYFHHWPGLEDWDKIDRGLKLAVDPYSSGAITDFYPYNSYAVVGANAVYDVKPAVFRGTRFQRMMGSGYGGGVFRPSYRSGDSLNQFRYINYGTHNTGFAGVHWVGDLLAEADIELGDSATKLVLELVEAGVKHQCEIDLTTGLATLSIDAEGQSVPFESGSESDGGASDPTAQTDVVAGSRHRIRFSNCDDQLLLWVDDDLIEFDVSTTFDATVATSVDDNFPRFDGNGNPLDAAPIGLAVAGGDAVLHSMQIDRDKYYVATDDSTGGVYDYTSRGISELVPNMNRALDRWGPVLQNMLADHDRWAAIDIWQHRRSVEFEMQEDQFFPMGDNSPESLDARCWAGSKRVGQPRSVDEDAYKFADAHYVPRDLLVGKALMVFWPHPWNKPVPFTPNVRRMKLIR